MVKLTAINDLRKSTLEAISSQDVKQIGNVLMNLVTEMESLHTECGIDQSALGKDNMIEYTHTVEPYTDTDSVPKNDYDSLLEEYHKRFSGEYENDTKGDNSKGNHGKNDTDIGKLLQELVDQKKSEIEDVNHKPIDIFVNEDTSTKGE